VRRPHSNCQDGWVTTTGQAPAVPTRARSRGRLRRTWHRVSRFHGRRLGQSIPPLDELQESIDKRIASGESEEDATAAIIEDFERSAATVTARTTPLVPASGIVVAGAGIFARGEDDASLIVALFAMAFALGGLGFLAMSLFTHAGRPRVGLPPVRTDIAFVHDRLTRKESNAELGSFLSFVGFVVLLIAIL
jgi:hypothetical protein